MIEQSQPISIEPMHRHDLSAVMALDRICFPSPWTTESYITELGNRAAQYYVARRADTIVGYGGVWVINHEAHITTLAVQPQCRRRGVGEKLLLALLDEAILRQAYRVSLEVRIGNISARSLYTKYGFVEAERRPHYYLDNGDDALILRVNGVHLPTYRIVLLDATEALRSKY